MESGCPFQTCAIQPHVYTQHPRHMTPNVCCCASSCILCASTCLLFCLAVWAGTSLAASLQHSRRSFDRCIQQFYHQIQVMKAQRCRVVPMSGLKRARALLFPWAFEQLLYCALAARSAFVADQVDCRSEAGAEFRLELPAEEGSLFLGSPTDHLCWSAGYV